jgi:PhnB protein
MTSINPYLNFAGNCEEAMGFYAETFNAKILSMMKARGTPMEAHCEPGMEDKIMHARIQVGDTILMASDSPPSHFRTPQGFSVTINADSAAEADRIFAALAQGGQQTMPIAETFWAHRFGMCTDRFGIAWMVNFEKVM